MFRLSLAFKINCAASDDNLKTRYFVSENEQHQLGTYLKENRNMTFEEWLNMVMLLQAMTKSLLE